MLLHECYIIFLEILCQGRIQDFNLGWGVKRVSKGHEVRGPKGGQRGWGSCGGAASPSPPANHIRILGKAHHDTSGISAIEDKKLQESMLLLL